MKRKKFLACALAVIMVFSLIGIVPPQEVLAATTTTATPIASIKYDFAISGVQSENSLNFNYTTTSSVTDGAINLTINGNGNYSVTIPGGNATGMKNMGYFTSVSGSAITAALTKITVNNTYELSYSANLKVGSTTANGLNNIWNTATADLKIAQGTNSYIARNAENASSNSAAFIFYTTTENVLDGTTPPTSTIKYPEAGLIETNILSATGSAIISNSSDHFTDVYNGIIQTNKDTAIPTGKYFKLSFKVDSGTPTDTKLFNIQPFDTSYGGWNDNIITLADAQYDSASDTYVAFLLISTVKQSLKTGKALKGMNLSFCQAEPKITLTGYSQLSEPPVTTSNPKTLVSLTEEDLAAAGVTGWSDASKAIVYVKITSGDSNSIINGVINMGPDGTNGKPIGKGSSKYLAGSTSGKSGGNAIQNNIIGVAGTGIYKFPDINLNKVYPDNSALPAGSENYITLTIQAMSDNTNCELLGIKFSDGTVYPVGFTTPTCESTTFDPVLDSTTEKEKLKLTLDYCATMNATKYTEESWSSFQTALAAAQEVYNKAGVTENECKAAHAALEDVKTDMKFISSTDSGNPLPFREISGENTIYEMGVGLNLGNTMDGHSGFVPSETAWQNVVTTKKYIKALHDAGYNTVRIPVTWGAMINTSNGYTINPNWMNRVQDIVDYCVSQDMYAIINIHHDGAEQSGWLRVAANNIDSVYEEYEYVWRNIANYFKDYDEHLIFESMNEISCMEGDNKNSSAAVEQDTPVIMNLNQIFVNVVRSTGSNNSKRWLAFVSHYANGGTQAGFNKPEDSYNSTNRLMFAAHIYKASTNVTWTYDEVYQVVSALHSMANKWDVPMFLGEYGTRNYAQAGTATGYNDVARAYFSEIVHKACQVAGVVPIAWEQGDNKPNEGGVYSYWNRAYCVPTFKTISDAMVRGSLLPVSEKNLNYDMTDVIQGVTVVPITKLDPSNTDVTLKLGETTTLTAAVEPSDTNDVVLWSTDDDTVATVYRGIIHAKGNGTTTIHAYSQSGSIVKNIAVTVKSTNTEVSATGISTDKDTYSITNGNNLTINAAMSPANTTDKLNYKSSNEKIVTINQFGKMIANKIGSAYVIITASSGITKTVKVNVLSKYANPSINLGLNVLYNDSAHKYYSVETGTPINVTGDGQYTLTFNLASDLSAAGKSAGITEINKLTALFIKDYDITKGVEKISPVTTANIRYDKVVVNGKDLTITNNNFKQVVSTGGILDSGGPLNGWDGNCIAEATTSSNIVSFTGITSPTSISVTFTIQDLTFIIEGSDKVNEATKMEFKSNENITMKEIGNTSEVAVNLTPIDTDSYVSFVSSNKAVVMVNNTAFGVDEKGVATTTITAVGKGTAIITAMTENGLVKEFKVTVGDVVVPGQNPIQIPTQTPTQAPTPTPVVEQVSNNGSDVDVQVSVTRDEEKGSVAASIDLPVDQILKEASESDKPLQLSIPVSSQNVIDLMKDKKVTKVDLTVNVPSNLLANDKVELTNISLDSAILEAAKTTGNDVSIKVVDEKGKEQYNWTFSGKSLAASGNDMSDVNLSLSVDTATNNSDINKLLSTASSDSQGIIVNFNHHGVLPAQSSVRIYVGDKEGIKPGDKVYVYYYNTDTNKLDSLPYSSNYEVDENGYITIKLIHCSDYVVLPKAADSSIVTSLKDQIEVTPNSKTLYYGGTKNKTTKVKVELPSTMELVKDFSDKTSSNAIGAVTVSYVSANKKVAKVNSDGTITAVGAGSVDITTTVTLYSGKKKVVTTTIKVKKASIEVTKSASKMKLGTQYTFGATVKGYDSKDIVWTSSKKSVITVDKKTGKTIAKSIGTAYIVAKVGSVETKIKVVVTK